MDMTEEDRINYEKFKEWIEEYQENWIGEEESTYNQGFYDIFNKYYDAHWLDILNQERIF